MPCFQSVGGLAIVVQMGSYQLSTRTSSEAAALISPGVHSLCLVTNPTKTLYEAGTPLFTKAAIKKLAEELDAFRRGVLKDDKVVLRTLNGDDVDYIIETCWEGVKEDMEDCPARTTEEVCRELDNAKTEWEQSEHHAQLQRLLALVKLQSSIKKVIGFALDPFSDPYYQERKVLETMGVTVLDDPWGFLEADESSIIISIAPDVPVRQIITDISRPAIIIWDKKWVHDRPA
ncbi:hypothetical protein M434DRAFT_11149 [Hypoxylon sp. CO27-5]|nr:hypothetical protein M434DRAFT_11149 [Hypoxylon sp. CO27-5]